MPQSLTAATIEIIHATAPAIRQHGLAITARMYERLFTDPEMAALFDEAAQKSGEQPKRLAAAILAFAENAHQLEKLSAPLLRIAERHVQARIQPQHYPKVAEALLPAIKDVLGDAATDDILTAWGEAYSVLAEILIGQEALLYGPEPADRGQKTSKPSASLSGESKVLLFSLGQQAYGIDMSALIEIREWEEPTPLPGAPHFVRGTINLRGSLIPVADLSDRLGLGKTELHGRSCTVVVEIDDRREGYLVDEVADIVTIDRSNIHAAPEVEMREPSAISGLIQLAPGKARTFANDARERTVTLLDLACLQMTKAAQATSQMPA